MKIELFTSSDLAALKEIQPPDWPDIAPYFEFYIKSGFCSPLKCILNGEIVGVGSTIVHGETGWLAHIIVNPEYRNKGIGSAITRALVDSARDTGCKTILLIATKLGEPVYKKAGFEKETEYLYLREGKTPSPDSEILPYNERYRDDILTMDRRVSGEKRMELINPHLHNTLLVVDKDKLLGFYISSLGEGLIIADTLQAGITLLKLKHSTIQKAALPVDNTSAVEFLLNNQFKEAMRGIRMVLGKKITWQPANLYSRIGGNLG